MYTGLNTTDHKQNSSKSFEPSFLFRHEVIWIQWFHWPNVTTCDKYPSWAVFRFHLLQRKRNRKHKKKKKNWSLGLYLRFCLCLRQGRFDGEIRIIAFELELCVASENQQAVLSFYLFWLFLQKNFFIQHLQNDF